MSFNNFSFTFEFVIEEQEKLLFLRNKKGYICPLLTLFEMRNFEEYTVNEIIRSDYRAKLVFKNLGIDFSTDKGKTLQEVCSNYKVSSDTILDKIILEMEEKRFIALAELC